jgi:predicted amidohydrolase YtcJ
MKNSYRNMRAIAPAAFLLLVSAGGSLAQQTLNNVPAALVTYPDMIVHNAKIYSMDDHSLSNSSGKTHQAIAIRGDMILAVGTNADMLALAGPSTKKLDVKGRAIFPGFIDTHNHLHDGAVSRWARNNPAKVDKIAKNFNVSGKNYGDYTKGIELVIKEQMARPEPGQWAVINISQPGAAAGGNAVSYLNEKQLTRPQLDSWASTMPVLVNAGPGAWLLNTAARNDFLKMYEVEPTDENEKDAITMSTVFGRSLIADKYFDSHISELADVIADTLRHQAAGGFTTYSSHIVGLAKMPAFMKLVREGRMPMRLAFSHRYCNQVEPDAAGCFLRLGDWAGLGDKYFWNVGMTLGGIDAGPPSICTTMEAPPQYKSQEYCIIQEGNGYWKAVYAAMRTRYRYVVNHLYGDKGLDIVMDLQERVMKENPDITLDFVRSQRLSSDHCGMYPRQDQIPRMKKLNITLSCNPNFINRSTPWLSVYGMDKANRISPFGSLIKGGVIPVTEYEGLGLGGGEGVTPATFLYKEISRLNDKGDPIAKSEAIDRVSALKTTTIWAAYYTLKEKEIGSLEPGKLADFVVFNKDFLTVPETEIPTTYALMTVLGGKVVSLRDEYAKDAGMAAVGPQIKFSYATKTNLDVSVEVGGAD